MGFSDLYEDLLDGSSLSLFSEEDLRRLIEKKEINSLRLIDYYKRKVHHFYQERGKELIGLINSLVVSAYGKRLSSEKKNFSKIYKSKIKTYGNMQFLDQKENAKFKLKSRLFGSAKMTKVLGQASEVGLRESSASADKDSALRFRRFGKNFVHYNQVVNLILDYVEQVKEFAHKLNGHLDFFIKPNSENKREGWFLFKTMVYMDLMKILFQDHKVLTFLSHLRAFFDRNKFYASRFKSIDRKLRLIDSHFSTFNVESSKKVDCVKDGKEIVQAVNGFRLQRQKKKEIIEIRKKISFANHESMLNASRQRGISDLASKMVLNSNSLLLNEEESNFEFLKKMVLRCYEQQHELYFQKKMEKPPHRNKKKKSKSLESSQRKRLNKLKNENFQCPQGIVRLDSHVYVLPEEIHELKNLSLSKLKSLEKLSPFANSWFLYSLVCLNCQKNISFLYLTEKLELSLSSVNNIPKTFLSNTRSKKGSKLGLLQFQTNNRISNPYSFNKSELVQDHLASPDALNSESGENLLDLNSAITKKTRSFRRRKKRKRRKRAKKCSPSLQKESLDSEHRNIQTMTTGCQNVLFSQFPNEKSEKLHRSFSREERERALTEKIKFNEVQMLKNQEQQEILEQIKKVKNETSELITKALKGQEMWEDTVKKLGNKRRKDERSRKKGQRRNKKVRMNENLKAMKAYLEWKETLDTKEIGMRLSARGVRTDVQ